MSNKHKTALSATDQKLLWGRSGNKCAHPNCGQLLTEDGGSSSLVVGEMAHIYGEKPGAARWDPDVSIGILKSYDNRILLCPTHHTIIDKDEVNYTVDMLQSMKKVHEGIVIAQTTPEAPLGFRGILVTGDYNRVVGPISFDQEGRIHTGDATTTNVTSHHQQGGITAGVVNIQPGDRVLTDRMKSQINELLADQSFKSIGVTATANDGESYRYASQIKHYLESEGHAVSAVHEAMWAPPVQGQVMIPAQGDGILNIRIGGR